MEQRRDFIRRLSALGVALPMSNAKSFRSMESVAAQPPSPESRGEWVRLATRIADPVLVRLAAGRLRASMPVELPRRRPWSETTTRISRPSVVSSRASRPGSSSVHDATPEGATRARLAGLAREGLRRATDPSSPDFLNFTRGRQPLVDAAFLGHAIVRAPTELLGKLDPTTRRQLAEALRSTRPIQPSISNWLLFSAMVEAALCAMGEPWDRLRVDYAVRQHQQWYKGDGMYGDGPSLHMDYYNSFVIHPMLLDVLRVTGSRPRSGSRSRRRPCSGLVGTPRSRSDSSPPKGAFRRSADRSPIGAARSSCSARWRCATSCRTSCSPRRCAGR
jgi:hypothetical protein